MKKLEMIFGSVVAMFFTTSGGISLSEVSRQQAEAKQQNDSFWADVADAIGGVFRKEILFIGAGDSTPRVLDTPVISPDQILGYTGVAERSAYVSSLMHALKLHKRLQEQLQRMDLRRFVAETLPTPPVRPEMAVAGTACENERFMDLGSIDEMIANLGSEVLAQFDLDFFMKANDLNSRAAVLGKLLSEKGSFFRELVRPLPKGGEQATQTGVIVTSWKRTYTDEFLAEFAQLRDELQSEYNGLQMQLNGYKKQIKDAVRAYNLNAERQYQTAFGTYQLAAQQYNLEVERIRSEAETLRQEALQELAALRVRVK